MNIIPLYDAGVIRSVMTHADILPTIIDDTWNGTYSPDVDNEIFLGCVTDDGLIGIYRLHWITGVTLQGHAHILKNYRKEHSVTSCKAVMRFVLSHIENCKKVESYVPSVFPNVLKFLEVCGFEKEGVSRQSFLFKGQLYDRHLMGITRARMQEVAHV